MARRFTTIALAATATVAVLAGAGTGVASSDPRCNPDGVTRTDVVTVTEAVWRPAGSATWRAFPDEVRVCDGFSDDGVAKRIMLSFFYSSPATSTSGGDIAAAMPIGSRFRVSVRTPANLDPVQRVDGLVRQPEVTFAGRDLTIEGTVPGVIIPPSVPGSDDRPCPVGAAPTAGMNLLLTTSFATSAGAVVFRQQGLTMGSNAWSTGALTVSSAGVFFRVTGCGDADPSTKEGFADGFIPAAFLPEMGFPAASFDEAPPEAVAGFLQMLKDNTVDGSADFRRATRGGVDGIAFDYATSYSAHDLAIRPDAENLKAVKKCAMAKAKVTTSAAADGRTVLNCRAALRLVTRPKWTVLGRRTAKVRRAAVSFRPTAGVFYRVRATRGSRTVPGTCVVKAGAPTGRCNVLLRGRGKWTVEVTSMKDGIAGDIVRRVVRT